MRYILLVLFALVTTFASAQVQFLGSPTTTVRNRGNFVSDSLFYLPKRTKAPSDTGAIRYQISDSALYVWTGSAWRTAGTAGSAITGSGVAGYMPEFTTATNIDTTRLYHSNGRFAIGSTTTTNGAFNVYGGRAYFDTSVLVGTNTFFADEANARVGIGTTTPNAKLEINQNMSSALGFSQIGSSSTALPSLTGDYGSLAFQNTNTTNNNYNSILWLNDQSTISASIHGVYTSHSAGAQSGALIFGTRNSGTYAERFRMTSDGHLIQGTVIGPSAWGVGGGNNRAYQNGIANLYFDAGGNNAMEMTLASYYDGTNWKYQASSVGSGRYQITGANAGATHRWYVSAGGTTDGTISYTEAMRINASSELLLNTITDAGAYALQVSGAIYNTTTITTGAPTSGSAKPWRLGEAATVSPTSPNRTIRVEIDGTVYYIHAKTTND